MLRRDLEDYSIPYAACAALALIVAALARGALPADAPPRQTERDWRRARGPWYHAAAAPPPL